MGMAMSVDSRYRCNRRDIIRGGRGRDRRGKEVSRCISKHSTRSLLGANGGNSNGGGGLRMHNIVGRRYGVWRGEHG